MNRSKFPRIISELVLILGSFVMLIPLIWMVLTSLKSYNEIYSDPPVIVPDEILWSNYSVALTSFDFSIYLRNSVFVLFMNLAGTFFTTTMAAYAFARLRVRGRHALFLLLLTTLMLPPQITIIPLFKIYVTLGWIDTLLPLFIPSWLGINVFGIFLLRQFFLTIPQDYLDAARIDGASEPRILFGIMVPVSKPAILTVLVFTFIGSWNDLWTPLIFVHSEHLYTLPLALLSFLSTSNEGQGVQWQLMMAASTIVIIPLVVVFFLAQRYFVEGITMSGLKG